MPIVRAFNLLCVALMWICAFVFHASLPPRIPLHFGLNGQVDSWGDNSLWLWFAIAIPGSLLTFMLLFVAATAEANPQSVNLPQKKKLLALPREKQAIVMRVVRQMLDWLTLMFTLNFLMVEISMFLAHALVACRR